MAWGGLEWPGLAWDVLDGLDQINICIGYQDGQGNPVTSLSGSEDYDAIIPVYEEVPGWSDSTVGVKALDELPENARAYIKRLETLVETPIDIISTGPDRVETIVLRDPFQE